MGTADENAAPEVNTMDDFLLMIEEVSRELRDFRDRGALNDQDAKRAKGSLDRLQHTLMELERSEVRKNGVSRGAADRFAELEGRIRSLQDIVRHDHQRRRGVH